MDPVLGAVLVAAWLVLTVLSLVWESAFLGFMSGLAITALALTGFADWPILASATLVGLALLTWALVAMEAAEGLI